MKLYAKLMLSFSLLFLIALSIVLLIATKNSSEALRSAIGRDLEHLCQSAADSIDEYLNAKATDSRIIAQTLASRSADPKALTQYLRELQKDTQDYDALFLVDLTGTVIAASSPALVGKRIQDKSPHLITLFEHTKQAKAEDVIFQDGFFNKTTHRMEFHFLTPVSAPGKNFIGILIATLKTSKIKSYVVALENKIPGDKTAFLVNQDGRLLLSGDPTAPTWEMIPDARSNTKIKNIIANNKDGYVIYKDHIGESVLAGYADLQEHGVNRQGNWKIFSIAPTDAIFTPVMTLRVLLIIILIVLILILNVSYLLTRFITTPLNQASQRINEIANAAGDLTQTLPVTTSDEIGYLARSFNKMIEGIRNIVHLTLSTADGVSSSSQQLSSSAQQLSAATEEIAATVQQIAKTSQHQAQQVQEAMNFIDEINQNVQDVANASNHSAATSQQATEVAEQGGLAMHGTMEKMNAIYEKVSASATVIQSLGQRSEQIGEIIQVITNIADQTNLLALNATIEAARAGESGRGFAVVADEVRKLAEGSVKAADQIADLIQGIQDETKQAVEAMQAGSREVAEGRESAIKTTEALEEIIATVQKTSKSIQLISKSTNQLTEGTSEILKRIEEVASSTEESAASAEEIGASTEEMSASMEEIASSSQELAQLAMTLQETVKQFKIHDEDSSEP